MASRFVAVTNEEISRILIEAGSEPAEKNDSKIEKIISHIFAFLAYRICLLVLKSRGELNRNRIRS